MPIDYPNEAALGSSASQGLPAFAGPQYDKIVEMIDAINNGGGGVTDITYVDLLALYNAGTMVVGFYNITDRGDAGIVIQAISASELALNATGIFLNPDFQSAGDYSGVVGQTGVAYTSTQGVWNLAGEAGYTNGMVCFYDGFHYQVTDDALFDGLSPDGTNGYTKLLRATSNVGYIKEADYLEYDFVLDTYVCRKDKRANIIYGHGSIDAFQWGNDVVTDNKIFGILFFINATLIGCVGNIINKDVGISNLELITNQEFNGNIISNNGSPSLTIGLSTNIGKLNNCIIDCLGNINGLGVSFSGTAGQSLVGKKSTFVVDYDLLGLTTLDLNVAGNAKNIVGIARLQRSASSGTISLDTFLNFPNDVPIRFQFYNGGGTSITTLTIVHGTGANNPHCAGGVDAVLTPANGDWIEFTKKLQQGGSDYRIYQTGGETY